MNNITNIELNGVVYAIKDEEAREALENITIDESIIDEKISNAVPVENGTGVNSMQSKYFAGNEEEDEPHTNYAKGLGNVALGLGAYTDGKAAVAIGRLTAAPVSYATAFGLRTTALGNRAVVMGDSGCNAFLDAGITSSTKSADIISAWNTSKFGLAKGKDSFVYGSNCLAIGNGSTANGLSSVAYGAYTNANGYYVSATGGYSSAFGHSTNSAFAILPTLTGSTKAATINTAWDTNKFSLAHGTGSIAGGLDCLVLGKYSIGIGNSNMISGDNSAVFGTTNTSQSANTIIAGISNTISTNGESSAIFGIGNTISGGQALVTGSYNTCDGALSFVNGRENTISGESSAIIGAYNQSECKTSLITGAHNTTIHGEHSFVSGGNNQIKVQSLTSSVIGSSNTLNNAVGVHVIGKNNTVNADNTYTIGEGLKANNINGLYLGQFNKDISENGLQLVIGKGIADDNRDNLIEYRRNGDTLDIYASYIRFKKPDGTTASIFDILSRIQTLENIVNNAQ